jgi:hypothetical protein
MFCLCLHEEEREKNNNKKMRNKRHLKWRKGVFHICHRCSDEQF